MRRPSLQRRVALTLTVLVVGMSTALGWLNVAQQEDAYRQLIGTAAETIGRTVAADLARVVDAGGEIDLRALVDDFAGEDTVDSFRILPPSAATAEDAERAIDLNDVASLAVGPEIVQFQGDGTPFFRQAVAIDGRLVGVVEVLMDISRFRDDASATRRGTALATGGVTVLALLSGFLVLRRPMRELRELSAAMERSGTTEMRELVQRVEDPDRLDGPLTDLPVVHTPEVERLREAFDAHRTAVRTLAGELSARLRDSDHRFQTAFEQSPVGMAIADGEGWLVMANTALGRLLAVDPEDLVGRQLTSFADLDQQQVGVVPDGEVTYVTAGGERVQVQQSAARLDERLWVVQLQDVTADRRAEQALHSLAFTDQLTGLANRVRLDQHLARALRGGEVMVMMVDLDRFKLVNDSLGHLAGDRMLAAVADRLRETVAEAFVARFGGDEFVLVLPAGDDAGSGAIETVRRVMNTPIDFDGRRVFLTASIGVALSGPGDNAGDLIAQADAAAYAAKAEGRGQVHRYRPEMRTAAERRLVVEAELREAIEHGHLTVAFQPIVDVVGGHVALVEALVRWEHPTEGTMSPGEFIPVAEETGLIDALGAQVVEKVCEAVAPLMAAGVGGTAWRVSINVSGAELRNTGFVTRIMGQLSSAGVPVERVVLEVTESVLVDDDAVERLIALRARGLLLAADDFGRGMTSLAQLMRFPLDVLKVDMSLLHAARVGSGTGLGVMRSVAMLGQSLGAMVVAEGVESPRDLALVADAGCEAAQGWHHGRPVPSEELAAVLDRLDPAVHSSLTRRLDR